MKTNLTLTDFVRRCKVDDTLPATITTVQNWIRSGKLVLPKLPFSNRYALTPDIIEEAVKGLKTKGYYHYGESIDLKEGDD